MAIHDRHLPSATGLHSFHRNTVDFILSNFQTDLQGILEIKFWDKCISCKKTFRLQCEISFWEWMTFFSCSERSNLDKNKLHSICYSLQSNHIMYPLSTSNSSFGTPHRVVLEKLDYVMSANIIVHHKGLKRKSTRLTLK